MKNKTSNFITIILIVIIIAVVGIVSYYSYSYFRNLRINKDAKDEIDDFNKNYPTITLAEYEDKIKNGELDEESDDDSDYYNSGNSDLDKLFAPKIIGTIRIPKTDIKYPIYTPSGEKVLEKGIGMLTTDNGLNKVGNTTLQGHNWRNWMFFSRNKNLNNGDSVFIKDKSGLELEYIIYKKFTAKPSDSAYIVRNTNGNTEISLSTCTNAAKDRLIILARKK